MVAPQFAPGRAAAVAMAVLLLVTVLPAPAQAQFNTFAADVYVKQGEAKIFQRAFKGGLEPTKFIDGSNAEITVEVPIYQDGTRELSNITVYWAFNGSADERGSCVRVNIPAVAPGQTENSTKASFAVRTNDLAPGAYLLDVWAFKNPKSRPNDCGAPRPACTVPPANGCLTDTDATSSGVPRADNNHVWVYFVKDQYLNLEIVDHRWCAGLPRDPETLEEDPCAEDVTVGGESWFTTTQSGSRPTFFEAVVRNTGTWTDPKDFGSPGTRVEGGQLIAGGNFVYDVNVTLTGPGINTTYLLSADSVGDTEHTARSATWDIVNKTGRYNVTFKIDPDGKFRRPATIQRKDVTAFDADVLYRDFTGNITLTGTGSSADNPYPYTGLFTITGAFTLRNVGPADGLAGVKTRYMVYIDNLTNPFNFSRDDGPTAANSSIVVPFSFEVSPVATSPRYIEPGQHKIFLAVDREYLDAGELKMSNETLELNESNNVISAPFFIRDQTIPVFHATKIVPRTPLGINEPARASYFPAENVSLYANVSDDDVALRVVFNFTLDGTNVSRTYNATKAVVPAERNFSRFFAAVDGFDFHDQPNVTVGRTENWTLVVTAIDSSRNNVSTTGQPFRIVNYPIHNASGEYVIVQPQGYPARGSVPLAGPQQPTWRIRVEPNMTGFTGRSANGEGPANQQRYTDNLELEITTAKNVTFTLNGSHWTAMTPDGCIDDPSVSANGQDPTQGLGIGRPTCTAQQEQDEKNQFQAAFDKNATGAGAGVWNWSVRVKDIANHTRTFNGTLLIEDKPPQILVHNLSVDRLEPGGNFTVSANVSDDEKQIDSAYVNFTRTSPGDSKWINLTLTEFEEEGDIFSFNQTFRTGRNELFGMGGTFNVTFLVRDVPGNWANASLGNFTLRDEDVPQITEYGVIPATAQLGENITFWAKARDSTNVSVKLEVFRTSSSSELLLDPVELEEGLDGNFTATLNFSAEGTHAWRLTPVDSVNRVGALAEGTLAVRNNVGPRFDIRSPSLVIDGVRYGSGTPRVEIVVHDVEGISPTSIDLKVAGQTADYTLLPAPGNLNGYLVTYDVRANRKFSHDDVVTVTISAVDNSSEALPGNLSFTFTVDDVAPIARLGSIAPSYRDQPAHTLNVSLNSRITLTAEDNDGAPTQVESIRYRILRDGASSAETVYTTPFRINDAPGIYTGPRLYQIQFWAEDEVGNFNRNFNTTTVYVDETPPALFQFFPQGRAINATFVDDRVGVNRSVVWYRVNAEPYVPLPLVEAEGAWSLTLPEGVKGDRVSYYLQAWDRLDNTDIFGNATNPYASFDVSNHEPQLRITSPIDGSRVFRSVDLKWEASDEDRDALVFTIYFKAPGRTTFTELAKIENSASRQYTIDTTRFPDGQYTFRVAAGDGGFVKLAETTVTVLNRASPVGVVSVTGSGLPGETMLVKAEITKAEAVVEARLFLDGQFVDSYPMNDAGRDGDEVAADGFYSVRVPITSAGDYSVEIATQYREDGELKESSVAEAATFSAKLTPGYILTKYGAVIALIGLLAAVGIGVAVFVVVRRR